MAASRELHGTERRRSIGRRVEDFAIRKEMERYHRLHRLGQILTSEVDLEKLFSLIMAETNRVMETERSTVFLCEEGRRELWSFVGTGIDRNLIRFSVDRGVAGWVFCSRRPARIEDAYADSRFNADIDQQSGFVTRNILCVPLHSREGNVIGVLECLNKIGGSFNGEDGEILTMISHFVAVALENARLFEKLRAGDKAKERVIHHLSHEIRTPLSILAGSLSLLDRRRREQTDDGWDRIVARGERSIQRLLDLQEKIEDIMNHPLNEDGARLTGIVEDAAALVSEASEAAPPEIAGALSRIRARIEEIFLVREPTVEPVRIDALLTKLLAAAAEPDAGRDLDFHRSLLPAVVSIDPPVAEKVLWGLLKNAAENTPDQGSIAVGCAARGGSVRVRIRDTGVGITPENQKLIFSGFFHTQETRRYASGRPLAFNAGGSGAELLRIRAFSERFGFEVHFQSRRCLHLPADTDACPGRIADCRFVADPAECAAAGGSLFEVVFAEDIRYRDAEAENR